jgi:pyruvate/2-oxoglutarate dehydrogenase complex dihydrolipoamide dehydrogenase (E3) component
METYPGCTYATQEILCGLTEKQAKEKGYELKLVNSQLLEKQSV